MPTCQRPCKGSLANEPRRLLQHLRVGQVPCVRLASLRVAPSGAPTARPAVGHGPQLQHDGVFYNKALAAKIGMTSAPSTLAQLDALLAKAKAAGILPVEQFDSAGNGGLIFPLQYLMADYNIASQGSVNSINNWASTNPTRTSIRPPTYRPSSTSTRGSRTATSTLMPTLSPTPR